MSSHTSACDPPQRHPLSAKPPSFNEALRFWTKLGFISFGGPAGQIAIMREYLVENKRWISDSRFLHALNYCMLLPGPEAQQLATYIGWLLHGTRGGLAAGVLFVLPSMVILLSLSMAYVTWGTLPWVMAIFTGLKPAVIAIVLLAMIKIAGKALLSTVHYVVAATAFVCITILKVPFPVIILGALLLALVLYLHGTRKNSGAPKDPEPIAPDEDTYHLNAHTLPKDRVRGLRMVRQLTMGIVLWVLPLLLFRFGTEHAAFWLELQYFFTKAAVVTFGGAYAVLPYVAQVSVEELHWLDPGQMIDGLALGETTPGPLIMVLVFVGFMAGYNAFGGSLLAGSLGLVATTYFTFLPCFLFIFIGAPIIERTRSNTAIRQALGLVSAAVVGVILNLAVYLGKDVLFEGEIVFDQLNWIALFWLVVSLFALRRWKVNMIAWIGISAIFGWLVFVLSNLFAVHAL